MEPYIILLFIALVAFVTLLYRYEYFANTAKVVSGGTQQCIFTQEPWYTEIEAGRKSIEARVGDAKKYKSLVGQIVKIVVPGKEVRVKITAVRHYATLEEYLKMEGWKNVAPHVKSESEAKEAYLSIKDKSGQAVYDFARVKEKGGMIALELRLV